MRKRYIFLNGSFGSRNTKKKERINLLNIRYMPMWILFSIFSFFFFFFFVIFLSSFRRFYLDTCMHAHITRLLSITFRQNDWLGQNVAQWMHGNVNRDRKLFPILYISPLTLSRYCQIMWNIWTIQFFIFR